MTPEKSPSQRLHDLKTVHADFKNALLLLRAGYKFDDEDAPGALKQLEKALGFLTEEIQHLEKQKRD